VWVCVNPKCKKELRPSDVSANPLAQWWLTRKRNEKVTEKRAILRARWQDPVAYCAFWSVTAEEVLFSLPIVILIFSFELFVQYRDPFYMMLGMQSKELVITLEQNCQEIF
jgi:hypothetical protein